MDRKRYKVHPRRSVLAEQEDHWLGVGQDGPDSLFLELEPYLYRADAAICQTARTCLHSGIHGNHLRSAPLAKNGSGRAAGTRGSAREWEPFPPAVIFPPNEGVGWIQGVLSEGFSVTVCSVDGDLLLDDAARKFGNLSVIGTPPPYLLGNTAFVVHCESSWFNIETLAEALWSAHGLLREDGLQVAVLHGIIRDGGACHILWGDGTETPVADLQAMEVGLERVIPEFEELAFAELSVKGDEFLHAFLKRHRAFFGKASRGACLARMHDPDFSDCLFGPGSHLRCAVVMTVEGSRREAANAEEE